MAKRMNLTPAPIGLHCRKYLSADGLIKTIKEGVRKISDPRRGQNTRYALEDYIMSAFAMFSLKDESLLQFSEHIQDDQNLKNIYKLEHVPSDTQMRKVLDDVSSSELDELFIKCFEKIQRGKVLTKFVGINDTYTALVDGVHYFKSNKKSSESCTVKNHSNGEVSYNLSALGIVLAKVGCPTVIPLCPEPMVKQDGSKKNDCEVTAAIRLLTKIDKLYPRLKLTYVMDAMFSNSTIISAILESKNHYIMGIKPDSHKLLYEQKENCKKIVIKQGKVEHHFEYCNNVSLNASNLELKTNVLFYQEHSDKGKKTFSWITDHEITDSNLMEIMQTGRARWKIENETFNTLKNQGYNLEHCYGLGKKNLSVNLMKLMMLAFLVDQVQQTCCKLFQAALSRLGAKIKIWKDIKTYMHCFIVHSMEEVFKIIVYGFHKIPYPH
jgi:hypothetical protein